MERLDKILAGTGRWSRKEAKALIKYGRVHVNGSVASGPEQKVEEQAVVTVDGHPILTERFTYIMLHKPAGVVSATEDNRQRTVLDLLPGTLRKIGLFPVGRLDIDTEGLLLLTNDGQLAHRLLAPGKHVDKVYYAEVDGKLNEEDVKAFADGITLNDGLACLPAGLELLSEQACLVTLREGKFHQVKRMLASRQAPVSYLKRISMGNLVLDSRLQPGQWRRLTSDEILLL